MKETNNHLFVYLLTIALFDINLSSRYAGAYALHSFCQLNNECFSALILKLANRMSWVEYKIICSYDPIGILQKDNILYQKLGFSMMNGKHFQTLCF